MATFSLGTSGITPGAPGVYINEQPGKLANADLASFSTVYMLVETDEDVPVTRFPFNSPVKISSLNDYKELIRVGNSTVPEARIPLLSYNCVQEFFANAQVGDLRVVRVGTPNQIVEIEFLPSATKLNSTSLPSALIAGNVVYVQMVINGMRLVSGVSDEFNSENPGYTADGEYLGVPVLIPVNYVAGDEVNNRKIAAAMAAAVAAAIDTNPAISSSVYVRDFGLLNDLDPIQFANSQNSFVSIAASTFDGNLSIVTQVFPVGSNFVFMQNAYDIENIVGQQNDLERVPQDYTQCIATAFDGVQDQGYLITPTAYAQFDAAGRALVGAAAAAHCENNNYKWMALADPGPYLVTDINKYEDYNPHKAAADLVSGLKYLVDNAIYEWTGVDVSYPKLSNQQIVYGQSAQIAIEESANLIPVDAQVGLLDNGQYTINSSTAANTFLFQLDSDQYWPVGLPVQKVTLSGASTGNDFVNAGLVGGAATGTNLNGEVYVIAAPYDVAQYGEYSLNYVMLALSAAEASNLYEAAVLAGGSSQLAFAGLPSGTVYIQAPVGSSALLAYADPFWDDEVNINGQVSDLIENITGSQVGVNTLHFPGTLQDPTETYRFFWVNRTIFNANSQVATYSGTAAAYSGAAVFTVTGHGLRSGQKIYFNQPVVQSNGTTTSDLVKQTTKLVSNPYWVKAITENTFVVATSLANYTVGAYVSIPTGYTVSAFPTIFYSQVLGGGLTTISPTEILTLPVVRGRKYEFDTSAVFNEAATAAAAPASSLNNPTSSIYINNSSLILGDEQINPYGEDLTASSKCGWLPQLNLVAPTTNLSPTTDNAYCVPTVDQFFQPEAYFVPAINPIDGGDFDPTGISTFGPIATLATAVPASGGVGGTLGPYNNVSVSGGAGSGATVDIIIGNTAAVGPIASLGAISNAGSVVAAITTASFSNTNFGVTATTTAGPVPSTAATLDVTVTDDGLGGPVTAGVGAMTATAVTAGTPSINPTGVATVGAGDGNLTVDFFTDVAGDIDNTTLVVNNPGAGYFVGDVVSVSFPGGGSATITINSIDATLVVSAVTLATPGDGYDGTSVLSAASGTIDNVAGFTVPVSGVTLPTGITNIALNNPGVGYQALDILTIPTTGGATAATVQIATVTGGAGLFTIPAGNYAIAAGLPNGASTANAQAIQSRLVGVYFDVLANGFAPDGTTVVETNDRMVLTFNGNTYQWVAIAPDADGGDLTSVGQVCYGSQIEMVFTPEQTPPSALWRFDAITSTEIIDRALRGVGTNGVAQAVFVEGGVDNVNRLYDDSQRYFNPFGFIAYYGPYIENGAGQWIPPSPYVTGVAVRRYRSEGYQFPPAGVKYQLADAVAAQIPINSAQQNLLNPDGCNAIRTLPGYPNTAVFIWGGRTRVNSADAQQKLYQFVNTRVILNVVYGSLRNAFDSQIFNVIDGFGVIFNQIISVGNSILNQLYVRGALFGARPSDAFQVICDGRINPPEDIENGIVNAKVFVTPVPTLERIQIDLIRVAIGKMQQELDVQGLGGSNAAGGSFARGTQA
jgi:hypothetical protein